jgi:glycosyltransferase involved in cell wall biosynthesis
MIHTVGGERDGQQGDRRGTTTSDIASRAFDVVVAGLVLLVVWPVLAAVASAIRVVATEVVGCTDAIEDDATLRRQHGRAARERVARMFRQEQIWEALHDEYQRLMRGKA